MCLQKIYIAHTTNRWRVSNTILFCLIQVMASSLVLGWVITARNTFTLKYPPYVFLKRLQITQLDPAANVNILIKIPKSVQTFRVMLPVIRFHVVKAMMIGRLRLCRLSSETVSHWCAFLVQWEFSVIRRYLYDKSIKPPRCFLVREDICANTTLFHNQSKSGEHLSDPSSGTVTNRY